MISHYKLYHVGMFTIIFSILLILLSGQTNASLIDENTRNITVNIEVSQEAEYVLFRRAKQKYAEKKFNDAIELYNQSLIKNPIFFPSMIGLADIAFIKNRHRAAKEHFSNALKAAPNSAMVHTALGKYKFATGNFRDAEKNFTKAISINPKNKSAHAELASLYLLKLNKLSDSIKEYRTAIELAPENLELYYGLSMAYSRQEKPKDAVSILDKAVEIQPENPSTLLLKAQMLTQNGQLNQAIKDYEKILTIDTNSSSAYWALGSIYLAQKKYDKSLKAYNSFITLKPESATGYFKKGILYSVQGDHKSAKNHYLSAIKINPKLSMAYNNLAFGALETGSFTREAVRWAKKAVALSPSNPLYLDTLGWLYRKQGDLKLSKKSLVKAASFKSAPPEIYYHLGVIHSELGEYAKAKINLKKALSMSSQFEGVEDAKSILKGL